MSYVTVETNPAGKLMFHSLLEAQGELIAKEIEARARDLCPVRTGELRDSIYSEVQPGPIPRVVVGASAPYAAFVELGTSKMAAIPFLAPAVTAA